MDIGVGVALREARIRRKVDLSAVESATRIRVRYLRAIENEEWDVLPGDVYARGFIRTYASFLGLDGERLADEYRESVERLGGERGPGAELAPVAASTATGSPGGRRSLPHPGWVAIAAVAAVALLAVVLLPVDRSGEGGVQHRSRKGGAEGDRQAQPTKDLTSRNSVAVRLVAGAEVWVCLLDGRGRPLVDGRILAAGAEEGPFRSGSFTVSFGNGEVSMTIDGKAADIPATASPIGYAIGDGGTLQPLAEGERPTCA